MASRFAEHGRSTSRLSDRQRLALFFTRHQIKVLATAVRALPRSAREPILREIDRQLAQHQEAH